MSLSNQPGIHYKKPSQTASYYEETANDYELADVAGAAANLKVKLVKLGKMITLHINIGACSGIWKSKTKIPTSMTPVKTVVFYLLGSNSEGYDIDSNITIDNNGIIELNLKSKTVSSYQHSFVYLLE